MHIKTCAYDYTYIEYSKLSLGWGQEKSQCLTAVWLQGFPCPEDIFFDPPSNGNQRGSSPVTLSSASCLGTFSGAPNKIQGCSLKTNGWISVGSPEDELRVYAEIMLTSVVAGGCQSCEPFPDRFPTDPELQFHSPCPPWECRVLGKSVETV